uniref:Uncharacterized protein n=1 Tax=Triticum urartu TaxID=4572 RepID=A0A8R7QCU6_TRIUA
MDYRTPPQHDQVKTKMGTLFCSALMCMSLPPLHPPAQPHHCSPMTPVVVIRHCRASPSRATTAGRLFQDAYHLNQLQFCVHGVVGAAPASSFVPDPSLNADAALQVQVHPASLM